ncbi:MAG: septum formation initiator family protein [Nitrospirae bacterium]|nr:MAG: septum formation initiator family protein [Nitrospirota bacterium]
MSPFAAPPPRRRWAWSLSLGVVLSAAASMVFLALAGDSGVLARRALAREIAAERARVAQLQAQQRELTERLDNLAAGTFEMERLARERLGLARKGELVYRFED